MIVVVRVIVVMVFVTWSCAERLVGASFRLERRLMATTFAPRLPSSASIAVSRLRLQPAFQYLDRHVAVAEVPG